MGRLINKISDDYPWIWMILWFGGLMILGQYGIFFTRVEDGM